MKKKTLIIIGAIVVIFISIIGIVLWNIKNKSSGVASNVDNKVSSNKTKHNTTLKKSDSEKSNQPKGGSMDKCKMGSDNKSKFSAELSAQDQSQSKTASSNAASSQSQIFTGYITTEDDFAAGLHEDTADMVYMKLMAEAGLGITFQQNGKWVFYYFDGTIATKNTSCSDGKWTFDGTGSQLNAWNVVGAQVKARKGKSPVPATVKGVLKGNAEVNPGPDTDGKSFPVITVESINAN